MNRAVHWLAFGVAWAILVLPAQAGWTARPYYDGQGRDYFLASETDDSSRADLFCSADGIVNLSLTWPDRAHGDAADKGDPVTMLITVDETTRFKATSYYWASGKGRLILDFGNPLLVRDIVTAIGNAKSGITMSVDDPANGIEKTVAFGTDGAGEMARAYLDWCYGADP